MSNRLSRIHMAIVGYLVLGLPGCSQESNTAVSPDSTRNSAPSSVPNAVDAAKMESTPASTAQQPQSTPSADAATESASPTATAAVGSDKAESEWIDLLGNTTLTHWKIVPDENAPDDWILTDGVLRCNTDKHGWLMTKEQFANFMVECEFRLVAKGNSGLQLRYSGSGELSQSSIEVQMIEVATYPRILQPQERTGAVWKRIAPTEVNQRPAGEWNHMRIKCDDIHFQVTLNEQHIVDVRISDPMLRNNGHLAISNWRGEAKGCEFRNLRIRELAK